MKKILIIGSGGAGKSTLAREVGAILGLEVIHLDQYFWHPGWVETPREEWRTVVEQLVARDAWVMDGNYGGTMDIRLPAADTTIFMDFPRWVCMWRVVTRWIRNRGKDRPDLAPGCPERLDWAFLRWIWTYPKTRRPAILSKFTGYVSGRTVVMLQSSRDVRAFLIELRAGRGTPRSLLSRRPLDEQAPIDLELDKSPGMSIVTVAIAPRPTRRKARAGLSFWRRS